MSNTTLARIPALQFGSYRLWRVRNRVVALPVRISELIADLHPKLWLGCLNIISKCN